VCKKHFERVVASTSLDALKTRKEAVIWLWTTHNEVNQRLAEVERKYGHSSTGDPGHPKIQWPSEAACPKCKKPDTPAGVYDLDAVVEYLDKVYGVLPKSGRKADAGAGAGSSTTALGRKGGGSASTALAVVSDEAAAAAAGDAPQELDSAGLSWLVLCPVLLVVGSCAAAGFWLTRKHRGTTILRGLMAQVAPAPSKPYQHVRQRPASHADGLLGVGASPPSSGSASE